MRPISFEKHCAQCHGLGERDGEAVPHGIDVRAFLSRLALKQTLNPPPRPVASGPRRGARRSTEPDQEAASMTLDAFRTKITDAGNALRPPILGRCKQCHGPTESFEKITDPRIPDRWMTWSSFNHASHRSLQCAQCHAQTVASPTEAISYMEEDDNQSPAARMSWTGRTRDIMMPHIELCRKCHSPTHDDTGGVRDNCVECHDFHGIENDVTRRGLSVSPTTIADFLGRTDKHKKF